jgi:hypothetical protein
MSDVTGNKRARKAVPEPTPENRKRNEGVYGLNDLTVEVIQNRATSGNFTAGDQFALMEKTIEVQKKSADRWENLNKKMTSLMEEFRKHSNREVIAKTIYYKHLDEFVKLCGEIVTTSNKTKDKITPTVQATIDVATAHLAKE